MFSISAQQVMRAATPGRISAPSGLRDTWGAPLPPLAYAGCHLQALLTAATLTDIRRVGKRPGATGAAAMLSAAGIMSTAVPGGI